MSTNSAPASADRCHEHTPRLDWEKLAPEAYRAMIRLDTVSARGVDPALLNLIKIRASQINHCAFCLDMHSKDALAAGEAAERIIQLAAWTESEHFYTAQELAAIGLTEALTAALRVAEDILRAADSLGGFDTGHKAALSMRGPPRALGLRASKGNDP